MKRHILLTSLSREHHGALVLAKRIVNLPGCGDSSDLCATVCDRFAAELEPHFREEEARFLPRLAAHHHAVQRTLADHAELRALAELIAQGDTDALRRFGTLLADHVRFEERELFPLIETTFPA